MIGKYALMFIFRSRGFGTKWMADYTGKSVKSSYTLSLYELDDLSIYKKAKDSGNIIIVSKDTDFPDIISRLGSPPKLINLRIG